MSESLISSTVEFRVRYAETDQMGVVYHANYLVWCEIGRTELIRTLGTSYATLEREGTMLAVADASLRFHSPARYDNLIRVETHVAEVRSRMIAFDYAIYRQEDEQTQRLVTARTTLIALDSHSKPRTMPAGVLALFRGQPDSRDV